MSHFADATGAGLWLLAGWSIRWGLLIAALAAWLRVRPPHRAATRHRLVAATLAAGLLLPAAPAWPVPRQPRPGAVEPARPIDVAVEPPNVRERTTPPDAAAPPRPPAPGPIGPPAGGRARPDRPGAGDLVALGLGAAWLAGASMAAARLLAGGRVLRRLRRTSAPLDGPARAGFEAARADSGVHRRVELAAHPAVGSPVALGRRSAVILVPVAWGDWPEAARRACLLHELAHLGRRDDAWKLLAELARVPFWFHPGVAWLAARLDREAELAADEAAVGRGVAPRDLARVLLDCARAPHRLDPRALAFSGTRTVPGRISRLLEDDMTATSLTPARPRPFHLAAAVVVLAAIAGARVRAVEPDTPLAARPAEPAQTLALPAAPTMPSEPPQGATPPPAPTFAVTYRDDAGRPVEGATVVLRDRVDPRSNDFRHVATVRTGVDGAARFDGPPGAGGMLLAYKPGYCYRVSGLLAAGGRLVEFGTLAPARVVAGVVTDRGGRPIAGAEVRVMMTGRMVPVPPRTTPGPQITLTVHMSSVEFALKGTPIEGSSRVRTDAEGRFRFDLLPDDPRIVLHVESEGMAEAEAEVVMDRSNVDARAIESVAIEMAPEARIAVRVVSRVPGLNAADRTVLLQSDPTPGHSILKNAATDVDGRVEFGRLPQGRVGLALSRVPADAPWVFRSPDMTVARSGETIEATIELIEGTMVSGQLVTADGRPAPGVEVYARGAGRLSRQTGIAARTDEAGRYRFRLPPGPASLSVSPSNSPYRWADGHEWKREFQVPEGAARLDMPTFAVVPTPRLVARVVDATGASVVGAAVGIYDSRFSTVNASVTDPEGHLTIFERSDDFMMGRDRPFEVRVTLADGRFFESKIEPGRDGGEATIRLPATVGAKP